MKQILIAPNTFKHSLPAIEVAKTIKQVLDALNLDLNCELAPIADGGDGTIDILNFYFKKSKLVQCSIHDPLMRSIQANWLLLDKETAVIELAKASGLALLKEDELNPMWANTFGTGELIVSALDKGCTKIILTLGGSATVDAGLGIIQALGVKIFDKKKHPLKAGGGFLNQVEKINLSSIDKRINKTELHILCDVGIPLLGETGTVQRFSTQKGAKEGEKHVLELGMKHFANIIKNTVAYDCSMEPMVGSAGGVAFSLKALLAAKLFCGFSYLSNLISLEEKIKNSDIIITGEGNLDSQTLMGKGVYELAKLAKKLNKTNVIVVCGECDTGINWQAYNIKEVIKIKPEGISQAESLKNTKNLIETSLKNHSELFRNY